MGIRLPKILTAFQRVEQGNKPRSLRALWKCRAGNTLTLMALSIIPLTGAVGLAVDGAQWMLWKRELRTAADLAAMAGARAIIDKHNVNTAVRRALSKNATRKFTIDSIKSAPDKGIAVGDDMAVRVELSTEQDLPFAGMFLKSKPRVKVVATARAEFQVPYCVVALDTVNPAVTITGSSDVTMNCALGSNSDLDATTSGTIKAGALSAVGVINDGGGITGDTKLNPGVKPIADPYAGKVPSPPNVPFPCLPGTWPLIKSSATYPAGCYAGLQIQSGTVTLSPGVYYIGEKGVSVSAGATLKGTGVTLIFTSTASPFNDKKIGTFDANGGATIDLSAPSAGTYAGILMYQDPRTPDSNTTAMNVTGNSSSSFSGAIYAPSVEVKFTGNSSMSTDCLQIIALRAVFTGNTKITNNCPGGYGATSNGGTERIRLIE